MKKFGRSMGVILSLVMAASSAGAASAVSAATESAVPSKISVYVVPNVAVTLNDEYLQFFDEKGGVVYPIIYNGSTYLPVRAASALMGEPIEWVNSAKLVLIGATLSGDDGKSSSKHKSSAPNTDSDYVKTVDYRLSWPTYLGDAYLKPDVTIMYDFEEVTFQNAVGDAVYPIIYNGSTYLPLRSIAELMDIDIDWDNATRTVTMEAEEEPEPAAVRSETQNLQNAFYDAEEVYTASTADLTKLQETSQEELPELAAKISAYYASAQENSKKIASMKATSSYTEAEEQASQLLTQFSADCESYVLILENIVYMAVQGQDYSILADVFFESAVQTQESMEAAKEAVECL